MLLPWLLFPGVTGLPASYALQPAVMFLVTIPIAFVDTTAMLLSWLVLGYVLGKLVDRARPSDPAD